MIPRKTIQALACDALNAWRDATLVLADALEENGRVTEAKSLRTDVGEKIDPLDVAYEQAGPMADSLARRLLGLARSPFYLRRGRANGQYRIEVFERSTKKMAHAFPLDGLFREDFRCWLNLLDRGVAIEKVEVVIPHEMAMAVIDQHSRKRTPLMYRDAKVMVDGVEFDAWDINFRESK